jgi:hypothetical protein
MVKSLNAYTEEQLKDNLYDSLGAPKTLSKKEFIENYKSY